METRRIRNTVRAALGVADVAMWLALPLIAAIFDELRQHALARRERARGRFDASLMETDAAQS